MLLLRGKWAKAAGTICSRYWLFLRKFRQITEYPSNAKVETFQLKSIKNIFRVRLWTWAWLLFMTFCLLDREQLLSCNCVCEWREGSWKTLGVLERFLSLKKTIKGAHAVSMHTLLCYPGTEHTFRCERLSCSAFGSCRHSQMHFRSQVMAIPSCLLLASHKVNISGGRECYY